MENTNINPEVKAYNDSQISEYKAVCDKLCTQIIRELPEAGYKTWHRHPVWFLDGNPVVGYSILKGCVRLLFWSGQSFDEPGLKVEGSFKAAEKRYTDVSQVDSKELARWLEKSRRIQWDYKNLMKKRGVLDRIS